MGHKKSAVELDENMVISTLGNMSYSWIDPMDCDDMDILGFQWLKENQAYYRMPLDKKEELTEGVDSLANCCAGGQLKFMTNSTRVAIDAAFSFSHCMYHMTPVGQNGFDCYIGEVGAMKYGRTVAFKHNVKGYQAQLFSGVEKKERIITINLPLYNGALKRLKIGLEPDATLCSVERPDKKVVVYGTSITQGGCASRPGMCYTNILSRMIDAEFINLGFSGNGKGEPEVINIIASINDMDLCIIDYEANIHEGMFENLPVSIDILREKHPDLPILILSRVAYGQDNMCPENKARAIKCRDFQKEFVEKRQQAGDSHIAFYDGSTFFGTADPGEFSVDGCHLTDYGFQKVAEGLKPIIESYL